MGSAAKVQRESSPFLAVLFPQVVHVDAGGGFHHADAGAFAVVFVGAGFGRGANLYLWDGAVGSLLVEAEEFFAEDAACLGPEVGGEALHDFVVFLFELLAGIEF